MQEKLVMAPVGTVPVRLGACAGVEGGPRTRFSGLGAVEQRSRGALTQRVEHGATRVLSQPAAEQGAQGVGGSEAHHHIAHKLDAQRTRDIGLQGEELSWSLPRESREAERRSAAWRSGSGLERGSTARPAAASSSLWLPKILSEAAP